MPVEEKIEMSNRLQPDIDVQREFWNSHWQQFEQRKVLNAWTERRAQTILSMIQALRVARPRILDFGCGTGWFTARLADLGEAQGIDLSPEAVEAARARRTGATFIADNLYKASLPAGYFDIVVSQEVISHVEDQPKYIDRAAEVLTNKGHLIITTGNKFVMDRLGDVGWLKYPPEHIEDELSRADMRRLLRPKFKILSMRTIIPHGTRGILQLINSHRVASLFTRFLKPETLIELKERAGFGWQMVVLAQKKS